MFICGLTVGFLIGNSGKERSEIVQIVPTEYTIDESEESSTVSFKVYDSDKLLADEANTNKKDFPSRMEGEIHEEPPVLPDRENHVEELESPKTEQDSESQFYEHLENNVFKNLRAEPPYSVPQIDEKIRSLRVKRYLPPGNKGQHNENFQAEGIVGRK